MIASIFFALSAFCFLITSSILFFESTHLKRKIEGLEKDRKISEQREAVLEDLIDNKKRKIELLKRAIDNAKIERTHKNTGNKSFAKNFDAGTSKFSLYITDFENEGF